MRPGGHIEPGETPAQASVRESYEELNLEITLDDLHLFDISITNISLKKYPCKKHYDIWYMLYYNKSLTATKDEFHTARWMSIGEAIVLMSSRGAKSQLTIMKKLRSLDTWGG